MAKTTKQKLILTAKILGVCLLLLIIAVFVFRDALLQKAITHIKHKMERDYNSDFSIKKAAFEGFNGLAMEGILLVPKNADTLPQIESQLLSTLCRQYSTRKPQR